MTTAPLMIIGVGNRLRGDDEAGLLAATALRAKLPGASVLEVEQRPLDLYARWTPGSEVVVIDAACSGVRPGTVRRFDARSGPLPAELARRSTHATGLHEAVELARALDGLPAGLVVYTIEGETFERGARMSRAVARAALEVVNLVADERRGRHA